MKQITMESIRQRIADLESAGKVVGGLSLSSEFELACLRELVAVTEQRDALVAENVALKEECGGNGSYRDCPACTYSQYIEAPETPATDAAIAALRAEGVEMLASEIRKNASHKPETSTAHALLTAQATFADEFARQLRESKGEVQS
ncbi:hypothetical protein AAIG33_20620 [Phytobacter ursingii]|uniref:hypothetical protein n=1 Tax=Phytobacter ursingii TaxID=1972431 RepID=UPI0031B7E99D